MGKRPGRCHSRICGGPRRRVAGRESRRLTRWSGRRCTGANPPPSVRLGERARWPPWGRHRYSAGRCRSGRAAADRAQFRSTPATPPEKTTTRRPDESGRCSCRSSPAQPGGRRSAPAGARYRRRFWSVSASRLRLPHAHAAARVRPASRRDNRRPRRNAKSSRARYR